MSLIAVLVLAAVCLLAGIVYALCGRAGLSGEVSFAAGAFTLLVLVGLVYGSSWWR